LELDHVVIKVSDWDRANAFFRDPDGSLLEFISYAGVE
jgi:catechol 2,3-dioxygenase-like lactoylglutathione lyase family enzyme